MLESFHGAFNGGNLHGILSESVLVGFGALGSTFSCSCRGLMEGCVCVC